MTLEKILISYQLEVSFLVGNPTSDSIEHIKKEHALLSTIQKIWGERASILIDNATYGDPSSYEQTKTQFRLYCNSLVRDLSLYRPLLDEDKEIIDRLISWQKTTPSHQEWIISYLSDPIFQKITHLESHPSLPIPDPDELVEELTSPLKASHCPLSIREAAVLKNAIELYISQALRSLEMSRNGPILMHALQDISPVTPVLKLGITASVDSCPDEDVLAPLDAMRCREPKEGHLVDKQGERITLFVQETLDRFCRAMLRTKTLCTKEELKGLIKGEVRTYYPQSDSIAIAEWTLVASLPGSRSSLHERLAAVREQLS